MKEKEKEKKKEKKEWTSRDDAIYCDVTTLFEEKTKTIWCERRAKKLYVLLKINAIKDKRTRIATNCSENTDLSIRVFAMIRDIDTMLRNHYFNCTETIILLISKNKIKLL